MDRQKLMHLIELAIEAKEKSYSPYSKFKVGCSLLTKDGDVYTGCNVENIAYSPTLCAERNAISTAIANGHRDFLAIVITGDNEYTYPCGVCRQFMNEFFKDTEIYIAKSTKEYKKYTIEDLLPYSFSEINDQTEEK